MNATIPAAPMFLSEAPAYIIAQRAAGYSDSEIRAALRRYIGDTGIDKAFARTDPTVMAAHKAECEAADARRAAKKAEKEVRIVAAPAPTRRNTAFSAYCRRCGGPASDGSGLCECCA